MDIQKNGKNAFFVSNDEIFSAVTGRIAKNIIYIDGGGAIVSDATTGREEFFIPDFKQSEGEDTSDATATAADILSGKTAYANGQKVIGTISTVTATLSGNIVTVPAGHIANKQTLTVPEAAAPTTSGNVVTVNKGYQSEQKQITVGTAKGAKTYTPGTSDQTISADTYLTGKQTIKGDSDLTAGNIKSGVSIFNVTGSFTSDADATDADIAEGKTAYVNGVKVVGTATGGGGGSSGTILYMPLNGNLNIYGDLKYAFAKSKAYSEMDWGEIDWTPEFAEGVFSGEQALSFTKSPVDDEGYPIEPPYYKYVDLPISEKFFLGDFTWDFWVYADSAYNNGAGYIVSFNKYGVGIKSSMWNKIILSLPGFDGFSGETPEGSSVQKDAWNHIAVVKKDGVITLYIAGIKADEVSYNPAELGTSYRDMFMFIGNREAEASFKISHLRILDSALWTKNFTPPGKNTYEEYIN